MRGNHIQVLKHAPQTRLMHWVHLISFLGLAVTGFGFYFQLVAVDYAFGGIGNSSIVHRWLGVLFVAGPSLYILSNYDRFARFIDTISSFSRDDFQWFKTMGGYIPGLKGDVPPQDKYNAGQKILGWVVIFGSLFFILTGFPMWLFRHSLPASSLNLLYTIHLWDAVLSTLAVLGHFFLAAIHPKSRVEFGSMMTNGYVDAAFSRQHNEKWYADLHGNE